MAIEQWGSLVCHTYRDTGHPFIMVISEDPWHSHLMPSFSQWSCHYCFNDLDLSRLGFEQPTFPLRGERSYPLRQRRGAILLKGIAMPGLCIWTSAYFSLSCLQWLVSSANYLKEHMFYIIIINKGTFLLFHLNQNEFPVIKLFEISKLMIYFFDKCYFINLV